MEFITTPYCIEDIEKLKKAGADAVIIATAFFSVRGVHEFSMQEHRIIREITRQQAMKMYVLLNRFFVEEELDALRTHLAFLKELDVDGIYYGDEAVLYEAKKLQIEHKLIYNPDTLITNKEDAQYYLEQGISMVSISKDITLQEICEIAQPLQEKCEVIIHGHLNMMDSKRRLLSNYFDFLGKKEEIRKKKDLYIMEETRDDKMPIIEDDLGTHVFTAFTLVSFTEIKELEKAGVKHMRIDGIFHNIEYICEALHLYQDIIKGNITGEEAFTLFVHKYPCDSIGHGFYYNKTSKNKQVKV